MLLQKKTLESIQTIPSSFQYMKKLRLERLYTFHLRLFSHLFLWFFGNKTWPCQEQPIGGTCSSRIFVLIQKWCFLLFPRIPSPSKASILFTTILFPPPNFNSEIQNELRKERRLKNLAQLQRKVGDIKAEHSSTVQQYNMITRWQHRLHIPIQIPLLASSP